MLSLMNRNKFTFISFFFVMRKPSPVCTKILSKSIMYVHAFGCKWFHVWELFIYYAHFWIGKRLAMNVKSRDKFLMNIISVRPPKESFISLIEKGSFMFSPFGDFCLCSLFYCAFLKVISVSPTCHNKIYPVRLRRTATTLLFNAKMKIISDFNAPLRERKKKRKIK